MNNTRFRVTVLAAFVAALVGVTPASADQPTYICLVQPNGPITLRNFVTHSLTIATFAEATGLYDCGL